MHATLVAKQSIANDLNRETCDLPNLVAVCRTLHRDKIMSGFSPQGMAAKHFTKMAPATTPKKQIETVCWEHISDFEAKPQ